MKKTISATVIALSSATSTLALYAPITDESRTYCLRTYESIDEQGQSSGQMAGTCDESNNNAYYHRLINANGCAEGQIALTTYRYELSAPGEFPIMIHNCLPPNVTQL